MLVVEGRKEDILAKYSEQVKAEKKLVSEYLSGSGLGSIYDYLITDLFMIDTNFKYLDDILTNYYRGWKRTEDEINPLGYNHAKDYVESRRGEIDILVEALKFFDVHKKKYKHQELRNYVDRGFFDFLRETEILRDEFNKKKGEKEVVKVFDSENLLVVRPTSYESSCLYGAGTKWCTASKQSSNHYENYSNAGALYYFITRGVDQSNRFYKVALFKNELGINQWWDALDEKLDKKNTELLESAYGRAIEAVEKDFETLGIREDFNTKIFGDRSIRLSKELTNSPISPELTLDFVSQGVEDNVAKLRVEVGIRTKRTYETIATFDLKVGTGLYNNVFLSNTIFDFPSESVAKLISPSRNPLTFELGADTSTMDTLFTNFTRKIFQEVFPSVREKRELWEKYLPKEKIYISSSSPYTFAQRDSGLIKKLTDWLDSGKKGGRLDFLIDSGILRKMGNKFYSLNTGEEINERGYLSTFFASALNAGIISTERKGRQLLIKKGPNYTKFKRGAQIVRV